MSKPSGISVKISGKEYHINCPKGSETALFEAAQSLDNQIREIKAGGRVIGSERIAIMAALNITHEMLSIKHSKQYNEENITKRIEVLTKKVDNVLKLREPLKTKLVI